ncbi:MAG: condensation domain-containing protein [Pseudomonadota bacterium]
MHGIQNESYIFPAAPAQERLWFLHQFDQRLGSAYNIAIAFKINSAVNRVTLQKAINYLVARHESLRTAIVKTDSGIKQVIKLHLLSSVNYFDYTNLSGAKKLNLLMQNIKNEAQFQFDLSKPGLFKISLHQAEDDCYYIAITMHHSIADGISLEIFIQEMISSYEAYLKQEQPKLTELKYQYVDIMDSEYNWKSSPEYTIQKKYWYEKLLNVPQYIKLIGSNEISVERTYQGSVQTYNLGIDRLNQVALLAKKLNVTNYTILMSAFCLLVHYYSNENDFLIGVPVANRYNDEMFKVIGFLANTVLLRVKITDILRLNDFITSIQGAINEYVNYQRLPYSDVVDYLHPERTVNSHSVFQLMFGFQKTNLNRSYENGIALQRIPVDSGLSKFDLSFFIFEEHDNISLITEYSSELFSEKWMAEFLQNYNKVLSLLVDNVETTIFDNNFRSHLKLQTNHSVKPTIPVKPEKLNESFSYAVSRTEKIMEEIWQKLLKIDNPLSIQDNFFSLGGNSLMVTQLIDLFQKETGIVIPIKIIFLSPTIKLLAKHIDEMSKEKFTTTPGNDEITPALYEELSPLLMELNH